MNFFLGAIAVFVGLIVVAAVLFLLIGREQSWAMVAGSPDRGRLEFSSLARSPTANDALACTPGLQNNCDFELAAYDATPQELAERIARQVELVDPLALRVDDGSVTEHLRYVTYSPNMRFPDLVNIEIEQMDDGRMGVRAYARAQLGRLDFDANKARLKSYFDGL